MNGANSAFPRLLRQSRRGQPCATLLGRPFVVAVKCGQHLWAGFRQRRMDDIAAEVPVDAWARMSVGDGAKGPRVYDWAAATALQPRRD